MCMYVSLLKQCRPALRVRCTASAHLTCPQHALIKQARVTPADLAAPVLLEECWKKGNVWTPLTVQVRITVIMTFMLRYIFEQPMKIKFLTCNGICNLHQFNTNMELIHTVILCSLWLPSTLFWLFSQSPCNYKLLPLYSINIWTKWSYISDALLVNVISWQKHFDF